MFCRFIQVNYNTYIPSKGHYLHVLASKRAENES